MGLRIDAGTAALLTAIASFSAGYWLLSLRLAHRTVAGVNKSWSISLLLQGCGWTLIALRLNFKAEYTAIPGTLFVLLAAMLQLRCFATLRNRNLDLRPTYFLYVVTSAVHLYFGYFNQNGPARVVATSVFAALVAGQTIWVLYRGKEPVRRGLIRLLVGLYAFMLLILAARGVFFYFRLSEPGMDVYGDAVGNQIGYAAFFLTAFLPSLGFFSLCNDLFDQRQQLYDGEISKIAGELTERYRIEEQLLLGLAGFVYRCRNDADWTITYMSRGAQEITGFPENEFVESAVRSFGSIMHPDDVDRVWKACQAGIAARKNCSNEYRIITGSGEVRWIWDQAHGVYDSNGALRHIEGLITDITERREAEQARHEKEILLNFALDSTIDGVWDWDIKNSTVKFSRRWQEMLGYLDGDLENDIGFWEGLIHSDDLLAMNNQLKAYCEGAAEKYEMQQRVLGKNGNYHHIKDRGIIVARDSLGKPMRMVGTMKNIDSEVNEGQQARENYELLKALFEYAPVGISLVNKEHAVVRSNAAEQSIYALTAEQVKSGHFLQRRFVNAACSPLALAETPSRIAFANKATDVRETIGVELEDQIVKWIEVQASYLAHLDAVITISTDTTDLVKVRQELESSNATLEARVAERTCELTEVNEELKTFSYSLSHDMKAPLTRIESWANILLEENRAALGENGMKTILFLRREVTVMNDMIRAMLSLAKASTADLSLIDIDVTTLVEMELALLRDNYPDLEIECVIEPELTVCADPTLFTILIRNLLDNAVKFSSKKDKAEIFVGRTSDGENPAFFVRDAGDGFDMRYADRLFGPYQRMHKQKEFPGTGIGLATAQRIVHRHSGRIWVDSKTGAGATFYFTMLAINTHKEVNGT